MVFFVNMFFKIALYQNQKHFHPKMHQILFGDQAPADPLGELTARPRPLSWIKGSLLLREGDEKEWKDGKKGQERE